MKVSRVFLVIVVVFLILLVAVFAYALLVSSSPSSKWLQGTNYPLEVDDTLGVSGQECVNSTSYITCIGGIDVSGSPQAAVYVSSSVSSTSANVSSWTLEPTPYSEPVYAQACVASSGYVYCVGGTYDDVGDDLASSYYAPLGSTGVPGKWTATTSYPIAVDSQYCAASSGYMYCFGGYSEQNGQNATRALSSAIYYAPLSSSGIGNWTQAGSYPSDVYLPSCYSSEGNVYCIGGVDGNDDALNVVYFAPLTSAGVGTWTETTAYPVAGIGQACAFSSGYIYCVGADTPSGFSSGVYYAPLTASGIGDWVQGASYPQGTWTDCLIVSSDMYCVGGLNSSSNGESGAVYYISLGSIVTSTTSS